MWKASLHTDPGIPLRWAGVLAVCIFTIMLLSTGANFEAGEQVKKASDAPKRDSTLKRLWTRFTQPGPDARPGVYWYFLDGNQSRQAITEDLESMARAGIGHAIFLEVDLGIPRGPVPFMSERWQSNFAHAVTEAKRLGIEITLGAGPGWAGSGGPWVDPEESMKHLMASRTQVNGPSVFSDTLPVPPPRPPSQFAGLSPELAAERQAWWRDVAVVAVPHRAASDTSEECTLAARDVKALFETKPYSIWKDVPRYVPVPRTRPDSVACASAVDPKEIVNLTAQMDSTGHLTWDVPSGEWTIFRLAARSTGVTTRPAPRSGHGFEIDKLASGAFAEHFQSFQKPLLNRVGPVGGESGWTRLHLDSWEMSSQNWTDGFRRAFRNRRGYDPLPYLPAYYGVIVGSRDTTEQFLWDVRKTAQELLLERYATSIREHAHKHGLSYSNQPYDMNPAGDIDLGAVADIPSCEFWAAGQGPDTVYGCLEAVSISSIMGREIVQAEAFTTMPSGVVYSPRRMKGQTDWAFSMGINSLFFHTFTHQPLGEKAQPGMTLGPHGVHWHRNRIWWPWVRPYHRYVQRLSSVLQQGRPVRDILYLTPEGVPHIFLPPDDAMVGNGVLRYKRGYQFDAVTPRLLRKHGAVTGNGRIAFGEGSSTYKVLVLPDQPAMTPETIQMLQRLVANGATIIGPPPRRSPSLSGGKAADDTVRTRAAELWNLPAEGEWPSSPAEIKKEEYKKGHVFWGAPLEAPSSGEAPSGGDASQDRLYPSYEHTARALEELNVPTDLSSDVPLRFVHRRVNDLDLYFVSNPADSLVQATVSFRVQKEQAQVWNPLKVTRRSVEVTPTKTGARRQMELSLGATESAMVVFHEGSPIRASRGEAPHPLQRMPLPDSTQSISLRGPWTVSFDTAHGGPRKDLRWDRLKSWTEHSQDAVRYFSGIAQYKTTFRVPTGLSLKSDTVAAIDLGNVYEMARVSVNGHILDTLWTSPLRTTVPTKILRGQENTLTIEVANNWNNRMVGDNRPSMPHRWLSFQSGLLEGGPVEAGWHTFTTSDWYSGSNRRPLQRAGLLGPVKLVFCCPDTTN